MDVLTEKQFMEMSVLVKKEQHTIITDIIIKCPVTWETIKEMLLSGLTTDEVKTFCFECTKRGVPIKNTFKIIKNNNVLNMYQGGFNND